MHTPPMNTRQCGRDGCENEPRTIMHLYCSEACERYAWQTAVAEVFDLPEPTPPEVVPRRTPEEMQERIDELKAEAENA